jgi:hypothetical protein
MQTKVTPQRSGSPVPGVIPEPAHVHHAANEADRRRSATPTAHDVANPAPSSRRRNPARKMLGKLVAALRGDKYMANAYPPTWRSAADAGPNRQSNNGNVPTPVEPVVEPDPAHDTAAAGSQIKEQ